MKTITVVGSLNLDLVIRAPRLPQPGETLLGGPFRTFPGGKGANQAVAASRLQGFDAPDVVLLGRVGADDQGAQLRRDLAAERVDLEGVLCLPGVATGAALITVDDRGENSIVIASGANARLLPEDLPEDTLEDAACLILQLELRLDTVVAAATRARQAGVPVLLNAAPARELPRTLLEQVDVLVVNRVEAAMILGVEPQADPRDLIRRLLETRVGKVVLTLGADGAWLGTRAGDLQQAALAVDSIDTVAAGDAFVGAWAVALRERMPDADALRFACAAGALATVREGAIPSLPTRSEVERKLT